MEDVPNPEAAVQKEPSEAMQLAWAARRDILEFKDTLPGTQQQDFARTQMQESFTTFILHVQPSIDAAYRSRYSARTHHEADVMQQVYENVLKGLENFRGDGNVEAWLFWVVRNTAQKHFKKEDRHIRNRVNNDRLGEAVTTYWDTSNDHIEEGIDHHSLLIERLEEISPKLRTVVVLKHVYDLTHDQIAKELNITASASKVRLKRAMDLLMRKNQEI